MIPRDDAVYAIKAIIAYGATPKSDRPIGMEEVRLKARAESITDAEIGSTLQFLLDTNEIVSPIPGHFRLAHKEGVA